ncbi:MAG: hypothetical protein HRU23_12140 [Gammaproteobacteria bacterium]|nr:hypothetical protein [Gammaproteobacteria bacterium]
MPRTYLEFEEIPSDDSDAENAEYARLIDSIPSIFEQHKAGQLTTEEASDKIKAMLLGW